VALSARFKANKNQSVRFTENNGSSVIDMLQNKASFVGNEIG